MEISTDVIGPFVTLDTNAIQALPRHGTFNAQGQYVVHDVVLREIMAKRRNDLVLKFWNWAKQHRKRLWIGLWWQDISDKDTENTADIDWRIAINYDLTDELRHFLGRNDSPFDTGDHFSARDVYEQQRTE